MYIPTYIGTPPFLKKKKKKKGNGEMSRNKAKVVTLKKGIVSGHDSSLRGGRASNDAGRHKGAPGSGPCQLAGPAGGGVCF